MNGKNIQAEKAKLLRGYGRFFLRLFVLFLVLWSLFHFVFLLCQAKGLDMFPAVRDGDLIVAYRLNRNYQRNDIVVCRVNGERIISRVAAVAGDTVEITEDGVLLINGGIQSGEILFPTEPGEGRYPLQLSAGSLYLLGDYRTDCEDSRSFGAVTLSQVEGKVITLLRRRGL
ncbi:MAG: signal peptidase I [Oscillospiraceae bacterium]|nr:signal peptidase I [Oscillospiraceae bacterium]